MKKKPPVATPAPQKPAAPPAKQAAPPQPAAAPKAGADADKKSPESPTPTPGQQGTDLSEVPVQTAQKPPDKEPSDTPDTPTTVPTDPNKAAASKPKDPIDWFSMRQPFLNRGVMLTGRDADQMKWNFTTTYNQYVQLGLSSDVALKITNFQLPIYYDLALKRDNPTTFEKFEADAEKAMGPGKKLGTVIVPVISPDTLGPAIKAITGKDIDFHFK